MWTSTLDLSLNRVLITKLLSRIYPDIYYSPLSPLHVANIPRPTLASSHWVRVRNRLAGICGSDLHLVYADADARISVAALPNYKHIYPGHEVVGEVVEIGEDVQHLSVGDRVALQYAPNCLSTGAKPLCRACDAGNYNLCEYGTLPGPQPIGAGWSEEMLLHEQQLFRLPIEMSDEQGVMLEPTAVALHAVLRHLPTANDNVLIIGAGTIGLLTLQVLRTLAPKARISMLARYPFQIEQATRLGADTIVYPADPYASVQRATESRLYKGLFNNRTLVGGYDVIYDTIGQQKTLHHAMRWLRSQGTMVMVGISLHMMHLDLTPIWHQEANLLGSLSHGIETWPQDSTTNLAQSSARRSTFSIVTELIEQKRLQPEQLITHRFALNNYKDALKSASRKKNNQSVKVLFDYSLLPTSAVPNVHTSARSHRPTLPQPQVDASIEELLQPSSELPSHQEPEHVAQVAQPNTTQQAVPPKILDTPPPQTLTKESWRTILTQQDIEPDDTDDEDTDTAIPVVKRPPHKPHADSRFTAFPQTPMPVTKEMSINQDNSISDNEGNTPSIQPNWQIIVRKPTPKQDTISSNPKMDGVDDDTSAQQQNLDEAHHLSRPTFDPNYIPVTSLPVDAHPDSTGETSTSTSDEPEESQASTPLTPPTQANQQVADTLNIELPEYIQDSAPSEMLSTFLASSTSDTLFPFSEATKIVNEENTIQSDVTPFTPISTDMISGMLPSETAMPTIEQMPTQARSEGEHGMPSNNQINKEDILDFLRYLQPSEPTYQPTQTLPSEIPQLPFPSSIDHTSLKLPAKTGEQSSPFSETLNMHALTEEQLPTQNILDNLFDADTSSMPAFLEHLTDFAAPMPDEDADTDVPTRPDFTSPDAPTIPDLTSPNAPTLPNASATALSDFPTRPNISFANSPTDKSNRVETGTVPSMRKAKKKHKTAKLVSVSTTTDNANSQQQKEESAAQEPTATSTDTTATIDKTE